MKAGVFNVIVFLFFLASVCRGLNPLKVGRSHVENVKIKAVVLGLSEGGDSLIAGRAERDDNDKEKSLIAGRAERDDDDEEKSLPDDYEELYEETKDTLEEILETLDDMKETVEENKMLLKKKLVHKINVKSINQDVNDTKATSNKEIFEDLLSKVYGTRVRGIMEDVIMKRELNYLISCNFNDGTDNNSGLIFCYDVISTLRDIWRLSNNVANGIFTNRNLMSLESSEQDLEDEADDLETHLDAFQLETFLINIQNVRTVVEEAIDLTEKKLDYLEKNEENSIIFTSVFTVMVGIILIAVTVLGIVTLRSYKKKVNMKKREYERERLTAGHEGNGKTDFTTSPVGGEHRPYYNTHDHPPHSTRSSPGVHSTGSRLFQDSLARNNNNSFKYGYSAY